MGFAVIGISLSLVLGRLDVQREQSEQVATIAAHLSGVRAALEAQLRAAFGETEGIAQLIAADGHISAEHFHGMAREALASVPYMRHVSLAPDDVISDVYPLKDNQAIIGLDYRRLPEQFPLLQSAREQMQPVLAGPVKLYQGGQALIYRRPVFINGKRGVKFYWGNVSTVADIDRLLAAAGLGPELEIDVAVRGANGQGGEGGLIWGDARLFEDPLLSQTVEVPGGRWQLVAAPRAGWPVLGLFASPLFLFALSCTGLFSVFVAQLNRNHRLLKQRNRELRQSQAQLERLAHYDTITGLPNRVLFQQQLAAAILKGNGLAVLMLDIDGFKQVNDSLGHPMGDLLLQQATARFCKSSTAPTAYADSAAMSSCSCSKAARARSVIRYGQSCVACNGRSTSTAMPRWSPAASVWPGVRSMARVSTACCAMPTPPCTWPRRAAAMPGARITPR